MLQRRRIIQVKPPLGRSNWLKWASDGIGTAGLGTAFAMGKLKFLSGDFKGMIKDPRTAGPFVKRFALMSKPDTQ